MGRELLDARLSSVPFHDVPDDLLRNAGTPNGAVPAHAAKQPPVLNSGGSRPIVNCRFHLLGNGDGPNVTALADQIDERPVLLALLDVSDLEFGDFRPA